MDFAKVCCTHKQGVDIEDTGEEILVYMKQSDSTFYLNGTAALVWRLCDGQRTGAGISQLLAEAYPQAESLDQDVIEALKQLTVLGVVEPV
jgi:hypothetical protein